MYVPPCTSILLAVISHRPALKGICKLRDFQRQWAWIQKNTHETLPAEHAPVAQKLWQSANFAMEVVESLIVCEECKSLPHPDRLKGLEQMLEEVLREKTNLDVRRMRKMNAKPNIGAIVRLVCEIADVVILRSRLDIAGGPLSYLKKSAFFAGYDERNVNSN